jgi:hypothetical protein
MPAIILPRRFLGGVPAGDLKESALRERLGKNWDGLDFLQIRQALVSGVGKIRGSTVNTVGFHLVHQPWKRTRVTGAVLQITRHYDLRLLIHQCARANWCGVPNGTNLRVQ